LREYADCFMLVFGSAMDYGMTEHDIFEAIREKLEINRKREWGEPDENGVYKHKEQ